jgi:hypothetical protein
MSIQITTEPNKYLAANSAVPLRINSTFDYNNQQTRVNFLTQSTLIPSMLVDSEVVSIGNNVYTKFNVNNTFIEGEVIYILDQNNYYFGYVLVIEATSTYFIINKVANRDTLSGTFYKSSPFKAPIIKNYVDYNLREDVRNYVESSFDYELVNPYDASSTRIEYKINYDFIYEYEWLFDDNYFVAGNSIGFIDFNATSINDTNFQIGDVIVIEQNLLEWGISNIDDDGNGQLKLIGNVPSQFRVGQSVTVVNLAAGQEYLNGQYIIIEVDNVNDYIVVDHPYTGANINTGGLAYSMSRPSYNGFATITNIIFNMDGLIIATDIPFDASTPAIGGKITYANNKFFTEWNKELTDPKYLYQAKIDKSNFSDFSKYVMQNRNAELNYFSTILNQEIQPIISSPVYLGEDAYQINSDTVNSILQHKDYEYWGFENENVRIYVELYNSSRQLIGEFLMDLNNLDDVYIPSTIKSFTTATKNEITGTFATYKDDVKYYGISVIDQEPPGGPYKISRTIYFELTGCTNNERFDLVWRDQLGSFVSYPFNKLSREFTEVDKKYFTQNTGKFDSNNHFTYKQERGDTVYNNRSKKKYILNTDWVKEHVSKLMIDAIRSNEVYIFKDNNLISVNINNTQIEDKTIQNDRIFNYTIEVEETITEKNY